jgi:hypothetical protein
VYVQDGYARHGATFNTLNTSVGNDLPRQFLHRVSPRPASRIPLIAAVTVTLAILPWYWSDTSAVPGLSILDENRSMNVFHGTTALRSGICHRFLHRVSLGQPAIRIHHLPSTAWLVLPQLEYWSDIDGQPLVYVRDENGSAA